MLRELHISNLAVIEDAAVEFVAGLNVFTGQTGAGKSLIIGAFEILLGLRPGGGGDMIRPGADEARVSGVFEVCSPQMAQEIAHIVDQTVHADDQLLITRKLFASGRSSVSVNGQPATAAMVRHVGQLLVDIHGQHDHQYLLKPSNQLLILDAFAQCTGYREQFADAWRELRDLERRRNELSASRTLRRQQLELYEFQAQEIDTVDPQPGEFPELQARHNLLSNLQRIRKDAGQTYAALYEMDGSVSERLQAITHVMQDLAEMDESLADLAEQVRTATLSLQESAFELSRYVDRLEDNPGELAEVEERLNALNRLIQKYGDAAQADDPADGVLLYRRQIASQIEELRGQDEDLSQIDQQAAKLQEVLENVGQQLHEARAAAASRLRPMVEDQLKQLGMADATFDVHFDTLKPTDPQVGPSGLDTIEMVVQTNPGPGQEMRPLRKIASGGELSRIMLAIKSILADSDRISVLVFDEIDANIGGRLGSVIGQKLRELANPGRTSKAAGSRKRRRPASPHGQHQVLCITHLPQIAAFADRHLRIEKSVTGKGSKRETRTTVVPLDGKHRIDELAEMMAGKEASPTTRKQARELMEAAADN